MASADNGWLALWLRDNFVHSDSVTLPFMHNNIRGRHANCYNSFCIRLAFLLEIVICKQIYFLPKTCSFFSFSLSLHHLFTVYQSLTLPGCCITCKMDTVVEPVSGGGLLPICGVLRPMFSPTNQLDGGKIR